MSKKDMNQLVAAVKARGYPVVHGTKHRKVLDPKTGAVLATLTNTPRGRRSIDHAVSDLKRVGVLTHDPRKEGQMPTTKLAYEPTVRQQKLLNRIETVLEEGGLTRRELAKHVYEVAKERAHTQGTRAFKTWEAAQWQIYALDKSDVAGWSLDNIEAAVDGLMNTTKREMVATVIEANGDMPSRRVPSEVAAGIREIAETIQTEMGLSVRNGRVWGHGTWSLIGKMALRSAERHKVKINLNARNGATHLADHEKIGSRMRHILEDDGGTAWAQTIETAEWFIHDWNEGHRIRPEDQSQWSNGDLPEAVRDTQHVVTEPEYEHIDVGFYAPLQPLTAEEIDAYQREIDEERWTPTTEGAKLAGYVTGHEVAEYPLHLRMIRNALATQVPEHVLLGVIDVAVEIMRLEGRSSS